MLLRRGSFGLSLLVVLTTASGGASCRGKASESLDAASDAAAGNDATAGDGSSAVVDSGSIDGAAAASAVATPAVPILPRPTPFAGTYRCFKGGMPLEQAGNIVTSTIHKDSTIDTIIACTVIGDVCTGTARDVHLVKTKSKRVGNVRPVTLTRTASGDIVVKVGSEQKADQKASGARGDQTFCPRR